jgi:hypothetical protein
MKVFYKLVLWIFFAALLPINLAGAESSTLERVDDFTNYLGHQRRGDFLILKYSTTIEREKVYFNDYIAFLMEFVSHKLCEDTDTSWIESNFKGIKVDFLTPDLETTSRIVKRINCSQSARATSLFSVRNAFQELSGISLIGEESLKPNRRVLKIKLFKPYSSSLESICFKAYIPRDEHYRIDKYDEESRFLGFSWLNHEFCQFVKSEVIEASSTPPPELANAPKSKELPKPAQQQKEVQAEPPAEKITEPKIELKKAEPPKPRYIEPEIVYHHHNDSKLKKSATLEIKHSQGDLFIKKYDYSGAKLPQPPRIGSKNNSILVELTSEVLKDCKKTPQTLSVTTNKKVFTVALDQNECGASITQ